MTCIGLAATWIEALSTEQWLLVAGGVIAALLLLNLRPRGGTRSTSLPRGRGDSAGPDAEALRKDVATLLAELEELTRRINAQLDGKLVRIEQSVAEADKRIAALRILIDGAGPGAAEKSAQAGTDSRNAERSAVARPVDAGTSSVASSPPVAGTAAVVAPAPAPRHQDIYALADEGLTAFDIAQRLDRRLGEVELILNLRAAASAAKGGDV